jgi:hypothetical protein
VKNKIEIDVDEFISSDNIREICLDEIRMAIRKQFKSDSDTKRIIGNIGYEIIKNEIEKIIPNFTEMIAEQTTQICKAGIGTYTVFSKANGWGDKDSLGLTILNEEIENNRDIIKQKVIEVFNNISENDIGYVVGDIIKEIFTDKIKVKVND